jgi:hypothetical protein
VARLRAGRGAGCGRFSGVDYAVINLCGIRGLLWGDRVNSRNRSNKVKRKRKTKYSKGDLNRLVDSLVHPFYDEDEVFRILDGVLHGFIEQDPRESLRKFVRYNGPAIVRKILEEL